MYRYLGNGFIHKIPARDLSEEEARKYGLRRIKQSNLYVHIRERKTKKKEPVIQEKE